MDGMTKCLCDAGLEIQSGPRSARCTECARGLYKPGPGNIKCTDCATFGEGFTTQREGATSATECTCRAGRFMNYMNASFVAATRPDDTTGDDVNTTTVDVALVYSARRCEECLPETNGWSCDVEGNSLERLRILPGFWRAWNLSTDVRRCFHMEYCNASATAGALSSALIDDDTQGCVSGHRGPYCELCVTNYYHSVTGCVECSGNYTLAFVFPAVVLVLALACVLNSCRIGRIKELADAALEAGKGGGDVLEEVATAQVKASVSRRLSKAGLMAAEECSNAENESDSVVRTANVGMENASSAGRSSMSLRRSFTALRERTKKATSRRGCMARFAASMQAKSRILVSLVQVVTQLGIVFSIPYPGLYTYLLQVFGVFTLNFVNIVPLSCFVHLNHDHVLLIRTLTPIGLALAASVARWCLLASAARKRTASRKAKAGLDILERRAATEEALAQLRVSGT